MAKENKLPWQDRTIEDIMEAWGEQRDEWVTELVVDRDRNMVLEFRHSNGKTYFTEAYQEKDGAIEWPDGFEARLEGKTLEQQMKCYAITESIHMSRSSYGEITGDDVRTKCKRLADCEEIQRLIVRERQLVGVVFKGYWSAVRLMPYRRVCTYYASENDGAGYNEREDYAYLICLPDIDEMDK